MKIEIRKAFEMKIPFTTMILEKLKQEGFMYVQVKGFNIDWHLDYLSPRYLMLIPIRELPNDQDKKEIYEPIHSSILSEWASDDGGEVEIMIAAK
jgi:hypothetical protein